MIESSLLCSFLGQEIQPVEKEVPRPNKSTTKGKASKGKQKAGSKTSNKATKGKSFASHLCGQVHRVVMMGMHF